MAPGRAGLRRTARRAHRAGTAVPARSHAGAAVREPRPPHICAGYPDRLSGHPVEVHVQRVAARHPGGGPGSRHRRQHLDRHREQPHPVRCGGRDQGMGARAGSRAVPLRAVQPPPVTVAAGFQLRARRVGAPHPPPAARQRWRAVQFGQDRHRVRMAFGKPGQGQVLRGQVRERGPPLPGPPRAREREIKAPRVHGRAERLVGHLPGWCSPLAAGAVLRSHRRRAGQGCRRRAPPRRPGHDRVSRPRRC